MAIISREQIVEGLVKILGEEQVITDEQVLKDSSIDRYRKYEQVCEVYTQPIPAAVVYVKTPEQVSEVLTFANDNEINVVPRTGHSAIEGGLETALKDSVVIDGSMMNKVLKVDEYNMQVTCQCGVPLQDLDDMLRERGLTTGHSPQSKPLAQIGGLVATRSIGQFSTETVIWWNRRHDRWYGSSIPERKDLQNQECTKTCSRTGHQTHYLWK